MADLPDHKLKYIKQKLTLALDKNVIDKAKEDGINISAITEQLLSALTFESAGNTKNDLVKAYERFFTSIQTVLDKYNAAVLVGKFTVTERTVPALTPSPVTEYTIVLDNKNLRLWVDYVEEPEIIEVKDEIENLFSPTEILENLIHALITAAERNADTIREMNFALRFLKTLTSDEEQNVDDIPKLPS